MVVNNHLESVQAITLHDPIIAVLDMFLIYEHDIFLVCHKRDVWWIAEELANVFKGPLFGLETVRMLIDSNAVNSPLGTISRLHRP